MSIIITRPRGSSTSGLIKEKTISIIDTDGTVEADRATANTVKWYISGITDTNLLAYEILASNINGELTFQVFSVNAINSTISFLTPTVTLDTNDIVLSLTTSSSTSVNVNIKQLVI